MRQKRLSNKGKRKVIEIELDEEFIKKYKATEGEFDRLNARMDQNHEIRNDLLKFSFTSVIASLGAALALDKITAPVTFLFLFPFVIMIPFQARISYYRLEEAHIKTYIRKINHKYDIYSKMCSDGYAESFGISAFYYIPIAWLYNHELVCLGILNCIVFWLKFFSVKEEISIVLIWMARILPVFLLLIVWLLAHSTYSYLDMMYRYARIIGEMEKKQMGSGRNRQQ